MIKRTLLAGAVVTLVATPAFAFHCPKDAAAIENGLAVLILPDDVKEQVTALHHKGLQEHEAGNHADAVNSLSEAMRLLLMNAQ